MDRTSAKAKYTLSDMKVRKGQFWLYNMYFWGQNWHTQLNKYEKLELFFLYLIQIFADRSGHDRF